MASSSSAQISSFGECEKGQQPSLRVLLFATAVISVVLLLFIPVWTSILILEDSAMKYMLGTTLLRTFIILVTVSVIFYGWITRLFFRYADSEVQTYQSVYLLGMSAAITIGILLLMVSIPLSVRVHSATTSLREDCLADHHTKPLRTAYLQLYARRSAESCLKEESVETCTGYVPSLSTFILKKLETQYYCSGFCGESKWNGTAADLLVMDSYPAALFSTRTYSNTCELALARAIEFSAGGLAAQMYHLGIALVISALVGGISQICCSCAPPPKGHLVAQDYGATTESEPAHGLA